MKNYSAGLFRPSVLFAGTSRSFSISLFRMRGMRLFKLSLVGFHALVLLILSLAVLGGTALAWYEGDGNNFFGNGAGAHPDNTAHMNSFFGGFTGTSNTTGDMNAFFGHMAGEGNKTGNENSFFGATAGYSNETGNSNSFFGASAGRANTTGGVNSFFGAYAGYQNETGVYNSFFGGSAGYTNKTGVSNSFFGASAGHDNETGHYNSFFGREAGYKNTAGYYNTFIGDHAGYNATGTGNVFLGRRAGYNETGSNKLYISNSDTSTPLIYGDFSTGTVVINGKITLQSSREVKDEIAFVTTQEAMDTLEGLHPVKFVYKSDPEDRHMGFISEDAPEPVATKDRKGVNPMDIITVLTKVVQEQQGIIAAHSEKIAKLEKLLAAKSN